VESAAPAVRKVYFCGLPELGLTLQSMLFNKKMKVLVVAAAVAAEVELSAYV